MTDSMKIATKNLRISIIASSNKVSPGYCDYDNRKSSSSLNNSPEI